MNDKRVLTITLNKAEQKLAFYLGAERLRRNQEERVRNARRGPQSDESISIEGIAGEIAFCKLMNVYPDTDTEGDRPPFDATLPDGRTVDVKTTKYPDGKLLVVPKKKNDPADIYALMIGEMPTYDFVGHLSASEVFIDARLADTGYGLSYTAKQGELDKELVHE
jgi:hypothetical protein